MIKKILLLAICTFTIGIFIYTLSAQTAHDSFPESWEGKWQGQLNIFSQNGHAQNIPMQLWILGIDSTTWTWTIIYGEDIEKGKRDYELKVVDKNKGHYQIDEKNSIVLDAYYIGGTLYEKFSVMGSMLQVSTRKESNNLIIEIQSGSEENFSTSGGSIIGKDTIPIVRSFQIRHVQKAVLSRME